MLLNQIVLLAEILGLIAEDKRLYVVVTVYCRVPVCDVFQFWRQIFIDCMEIAEQGFAACRRNLDCPKNRAQAGDSPKRTVGMPDAGARQVACIIAFYGKDPAVFADVRNAVNLGLYAGAVGLGRMDFQFPELPAESDLFGFADILFRKDQNMVINQSLGNEIEVGGRDFRIEVYAFDLRTKCSVQRVDLKGHCSRVYSSPRSGFKKVLPVSGT